VRQRERDFPAGPTGEQDAHSLLFGLTDDEPDADPGAGAPAPRLETRTERRRSELAYSRRRRRRGRLFVLLTVVIVAVVAVVIVPRVIDYFQVKDYSGDGAGQPTVDIVIVAGDTASDIADTLKQHGVVQSTTAFTDAASNNSRAGNIQPGSYTVHRHMSGKAALAALLDPSSRNAQDDVVVTEGATTIDVADRVGAACRTQPAALQQAMKSGGRLGVPVTYKVGDKVPASLEGFLYPATYTFDPHCSAADALQKMVSRFIQQDRSTQFAAAAPRVGLTPYQALIVASIAQSEAKFPEDMPRVVRTILNRLAAHKPLQFDSTSAYACRLANQTHCIYSQVDSPYNSYTNTGLPPTPIDNPGADAMQAAVHPSAGDWLFFVNKDKAGHLFFTHDPDAFERAREKCAKNNWGCA
jgi:UPF0755 protein